MPRPKQTDEERAAARLKTQELVQEIKRMSRLSTEHISLAFQFHEPPLLQVSGAMLRQYLMGAKSASLKKRIALSRAALEMGWAGKLCRKTLSEAILTDMRPMLSKVLLDCKNDVNAALQLITQEILAVEAKHNVIQAKHQQRDTGLTD